jgi:hypothetical protein
MTIASRCLLLIALAIATTSAAAQQSARFYVGAGGGQVHSMDYCGPYFDTVVVACEDTTLAYKVFGGMQLLDFLAVEASSTGTSPCARSTNTSPTSARRPRQATPTLDFSR